MTQPVKFGLNVDPNTGGLPIAERITAIADAHPAHRVTVDILPRLKAGIPATTPFGAAGEVRGSMAG
jgi:hypothetical protein